MADDVQGIFSFLEDDQQSNQGGQTRDDADLGIQDNPGRDTPEKWAGPKDIRGEKGAGTYPNQVTWKSRSGNCFMYDDSEGFESMTIQHRSGSCMQFLPNGAVHLVSHHGNYQVVFGEKRMTVTGAHDMTVKGDGSMRVYGNYDKTIHGDKNETITGTHNYTSQNLNQMVRGNIDQQARNKNIKLAGNFQQATLGATSMVSKRQMSVASNADALHLGGAEVGVESVGKMAFNTGDNVHFGANDGNVEITGKEVKILGKQVASVVGDDVRVNAKSDKLSLIGQGVHLSGSEIHLASIVYSNPIIPGPQPGQAGKEAKTARAQGKGGKQSVSTASSASPAYNGGNLA